MRCLVLLRRCRLYFLCLAVSFFGGARLNAQDALTASFLQLREDAKEVVDPGGAEKERAALFASWMNGNDWQSLSTSDQFELHEGLSADTLDRRQMSVRWTGFLISPSTASYTLSQVQQYSQAGESIIKVWLNGELALDSTPQEGAAEEARFRSKPISLEANQPVDLRVELTHNVQHEPYYSDGVPMAVLTWQATNVPRQIIPASAYSPPAGFGDGATQGLKGEYFSDTNFTQPNSTRLDGGLDFVWAWRPVCGEHSAKQSEIVAACRAKMLDELFLTDLDNESDRREFFDSPGWRFCHYLPLSDRKQYIERLTQYPDLLGAMSSYNMGKLFETVYMLPGKEHLDLLQAWCEAKPQPRYEIGILPGSGEGFYETINTEFYWLIGNFLQGPYWSDVETLWADHLRLPNGECNLRIARATAYAAFHATKSDQIRERLQQGASEPGLGGDQRATWLLAKGFAEEVMVAGSPQPMRAIDFVEEASLVAESEDYRFWALQELVARLGSVGETERASQLVDEKGGAFTSAQHQQEMQRWRDELTTVASVYTERENTPDTTSLESYIAELERRLAKANERGDTSRAARYQALLQSANNALLKLQN